MFSGMRPWKLWLVMALTFLGMVGVTAAFIVPILMFMGAFTPLAVAVLVAIMIFIQWLIAPGLIGAVYNLRPAEGPRYRWLREALERVARRSGLKRVPRLYIADIPIPNAFAYGSWLTGPRVAVTRGLLEVLDRDEVEAVLGHEVGHLRHRDVQLMMLLSVLPALVYMIARYAYYSAWYSGDSREGSSPALLFVIGILGFLVYIVLNLLLLGFSRLREYYADYNGATVVEDGAMKLAVALAKISNATSVMKSRAPSLVSSASKFKALLILDPEAAIPVYAGGEEALVMRIASRRMTLEEKIAELFSTHPHIVKRLRNLLRLAGRPLPGEGGRYYYY